MISSLLDPRKVPISPPMDLNPGGPDDEAISVHPMKLRTDRSVGLFGTRRNSGVANGLARFHEGVDLLAPQGQKIFAVAPGRVVLVNALAGGTLIAIHHTPFGLGVVTRYIHLQNPLVAVNEDVEYGQQIAEVGLPAPVEHLHFELRQLFEPVAMASGNSKESMPLDPTMLLYQWEVNRFTNDAASRHVEDDVQIATVEDVVRDRMLRFVLITLKNKPGDFFIPMYDPTPADLNMVATAKEACFRNSKIRLVWRNSLFFAQIQRNPFAKIVAEIKVHAPLF